MVNYTDIQSLFLKNKKNKVLRPYFLSEHAINSYVLHIVLTNLLVKINNSSPAIIEIIELSKSCLGKDTNLEGPKLHAKNTLSQN